MKIIKNLLSLSLLSILIFSSSCSDDDSSNVKSCLKDSFQLTETKVNDLSPSSDAVIVSFNLKNNSSTNYSIQDGSSPIYTTMIVTTADGATFETTNILTVSSLSAGGTAAVDVLGNYGAGKTYKSYKVSLSCK